MQNYQNNIKDYRKYLEGKKVILVGPSKSLKNSGLGKKINAADVVVRMNQSYPVMSQKKYHKDIGSRTDVLYHTGAINTMLHYTANKFNLGRIQMLQGDGIKYFVSKRDPLNGSSRDKAFLGKFIKINSDFEKAKRQNKQITIVPVTNIFLGELQTILNRSDPNMSTLTILHILSMDIKSLEIVGCDFYSVGYHPFYSLPVETLKWDDLEKKLVRVDGKKRRKGKLVHNYNIQIKLLLEVFRNDDRIIIDNKILKEWRSKI
ncbi:MAG: glycosyltransferase family 29 protein [Spirochaetes bacterium]|nr:glycosyltransferase family 29 protein [Spirochaetota bacterium]